MFIHKFEFGFSTKIAGYFKHASPGIDDETIGSSVLKTLVNISQVKTTGIELSLTYQHIKLPISGFFNVAISHAYGIGAITGGFLPILDYGSGTDMDHDQRLTISGGITYHPKNWFVDLSSDYGSGLSNGNPNNAPYKLGLFDFNPDTHVKPWIIFDLGCGYTFNFKNGVTVQPSLYINNVLDNPFILNGAALTAGSYGERRNVQLKLNLHI